MKNVIIWHKKSHNSKNNGDFAGFPARALKIQLVLLYGCSVNTIDQICAVKTEVENEYIIGQICTTWTVV